MSIPDLIVSTSGTPIEAAASWVETVLLGTIATTLAMIAIAAVGLTMLTGRLELRKGVTVIVGCFVVFGASMIVAGLQSAVRADPGPVHVVVAAPAPPAGIPPARAPDIPAVSDPYAGASVPRNR